MNIFDPHITGSLSVSASAHIEGDLTVLGTIRGTAEINGEVDSAISASHAAEYLLTSSFEGVSGSFAITGSNTFKGDQTISGSLLPDGTLIHDIGSDSNRWRDIYLAGSTINLGGTKITKDDNGNVEFKDQNNVLKKIVTSEIQLGTGNNKKLLKVSNGKLKLFSEDESNEEDASFSGSFTGSFTGDGSNLTNVPASGVTGLSLDSISSGSNSLEMGRDVLVSNVSILPNITDTIDLGSPDKQWRDLFLSSGSLYINGQQVISTTGNELRITTDEGESIKIIETSSDTITLQTEDGDITLSSSGNGNIELDAPIQVGAGNKILSSDGNEIQFGNGLSITGSIVLSGTVDGVDVSGLKSNVDAILSGSQADKDSFAEIVTLINSVDTTNDEAFAAHYTSSNNRFVSLETTSGSQDGRITSLEATSGSNLLRISSLETTSGSHDDRLILLESFTGSVDGTMRGDFNTYTSSNDSTNTTQNGRLDSLETKTGSLSTDISNLSNRSDALEEFTSSVNDTYATDSDVTTLRGDLNTYTSSNDSTNTTQNNRLGSLETKTGSLDNTNTTQNNRLSSLETFTGSLDETFASDTDVTTLRDDLNTYTSSTDTSILIESLRINSIESFTASVDDTYATDSDVTTLRGDLNTYTSSNNVSGGERDGRLDSLETKTGSLSTDITGLDGRLGSIETKTGSLSTDISNLSSRSDALEEFTSSIDDTYATDTDVTNLTNRVGSLETKTGSLDSDNTTQNNRLNSLETTSGSQKTKLGEHRDRLDSIESFTGSINDNYATDTDVTTLRGDLNTYTSSNDTEISNQDLRLVSLETESGSVRGDFNTYTSSNNSTNTTQNNRLGSLETTSGSHDGRLDSIETKTGSLSTDIAGLDGRLDTIEGGLEFTGSNVTIKGDLLVKGTETRVDSTTVEIGDNIISLNGSGAQNAGIEVRDNTSPDLLSGSLIWDGETNFWKGGQKGSEERLLTTTDLSNIEDTSGSHDGRLDSIESKTGSFLTSTNLSSLEGKVDSLETTSGSHDERIDSLEVESGSIRTTLNSYTSSNNQRGVERDERLGLLEEFTGSINDTYATDTDVTTLRGELNSYTSSNDTTNTNQNNRLGSLETKTGSLDTTNTSQNNRLNSIETKTGSLDGRVDSLEEFTSSIDDTYATDANVTTLRGDLNSYTSSNNTTNTTQNNRLNSIETKTGSLDGDITNLRGDFNSHTSSNNTTNTTQNSRLTSLESETGSYTTTDYYTTGVTFNNTNGVITGTRNDGGTWTVDIDGRYLTSFTETDPIFTASPSANITDENIENWNIAYGWGDHSQGGYLTSYNDEYTTGATFNTSNGIITFTRNDGDTFTVDLGGKYSESGHNHDSDYVSVNGDIMSGTLDVHVGDTGTILSSGNSSATGIPDQFFIKHVNGGVAIGNLRGDINFTSGTLKNDGNVIWDQGDFTATNVSNWDTAYEWGDHSQVGYLTSYVDSNFYTTGTTWNGSTATLTFTRNDGNSYQVQMLETLSDVTVTGGTYNSGTQTLRLTKSDGDTVDVSGFAIDTDVNWYTTGATFNTTNGIITGTRNDGGTWTVDLDGRYLTSFTETDPIFTASPSAGIAETDITNWDTAYGWGDHSQVGYLTSYNDEYTTGATFNSDNGVITFTRNDGDTYTVGVDGRYLTSFTETDTLDSVTSRGSSTSNRITVGGVNLNDGNSIIEEAAGNAFRFKTGTGYIDIGSKNSGWIHFEGNRPYYFGTSSTVFDGDVRPYTNNVRSLGSASYRWSQIFANGGDSTQWNSAYGWGDHADGGYLTSYTETDTLSDVVSRGSNFGNSQSGFVTNNTWGSEFRRIKRVTFTNGNANWDSDNHGVFSTDPSGTYSDSMSVNSYNDLTLRVDTNNNNDASYVRFSQHSTGAGTEWFRSGFDGGQYVNIFRQSGYVAFEGLDFAISNSNSNHGFNNYFRGDSSHLVIGTGGTLYLNYGQAGGDIRMYGNVYLNDTVIVNSSRVLQNVTGNISMFTNDSNYLTEHPSITAASSSNNSGRTYIQDILLDGNGHVTGVTTSTETVVNTNDNDIDYINSTTFNTSTGVVTGTGVGNAGFTVDIDGRYLLDTSDTFTGSLTINGDIRGNGQQLVLNAGESYSYATGQTSEYIYLNAEQGLEINSHTGNWSGGWGTRKTALLRGDLLRLDGEDLTKTNIQNFKTAYGWGDHSQGGYLTSYNDEYVTGASWNSGTAVLTFTRNDGDTFNVNLLNTLSDVTVTGGTYNSGNQTLTLTKSDGGTVAVSGFAIDTDVNWYTTGATFNTSNGIITGTHQGGTWTVDLDGRYLTSESNSFLGDGGSANSHPGTNRVIFTGQVSQGSGALGMPTVDNSNSFLNINRHSGEYNSQLGFSSNGNIYYRSFSNTAINGTQAWLQVYHSGNFANNSGNWNTAYGWGDHSQEGYITSPDGGNAGLLDGIDSGQFLRSDVSDTHTATLTVNGQFIFNSSTNSDYREGIRLNQSTGGWGGGVFGGIRNSISGITDAWWVARNPSKDFVISYGTSSNSGGLHLPHNSSALSYKNNRIWNEGDFANNSSNWNTAYGWGDHSQGGYAVLSASNSFTNSYNEFGNGTGSVSNDGSWNARLNVAGTSHARLDVKSVSDGIITTMFSHTGNGAGKMGTMSNHPLKLMVGGTDRLTLDSSSNLTITGTMNSNTVTTNQVTAGKLNLASDSYEGSIVFGSSDTWHTGIRQHDDADAELRIWAKSNNGMIFLSTGYDGEPANISRPTDGLVVGPNNKVGIGNFSVNGNDPNAKLHVKGSTAGETIFNLEGTSGQLFSITDDLTGDLFSVSDASGVPIFNVNANGTVSIDSLGLLTVGGSITGNSFIKSGGTSSQFLKADGSVDSTTYVSTTGYNNSNWDTAYGWGDHASAGYIVQGSTQPDGGWTSATKFKSSGSIADADSGSHSLQIISDNNNDAFMAFHVSGDYAVFLGLDGGSNRLHTGGWSAGANQYMIWDSRDFSSTDITNWDTAYGWGDHSQGGYLTSFTETDPIFTASPSAGITDENIENWNIAHGWGDHASGNYLTSYSETDTLSSVIDRGNTTSGSISFTGTGPNTGIKFNSTVVQNDGFGIRVNGTSNAGELEFYSTDDDTEPFVFRHYTVGQDGTGSSVEWFRIGAGGNISTPGTITASGYNKNSWDTAHGWGDHGAEGYATETYVGNAISDLVDSSPTTLDTLNELAAALGDDANFSTTVTNSIATKLPLSGGTLTGDIIGPGGRFRKSQSDNNYTTAALWTESYNTTTTGIAFHISGTVGKFLEMRTNGVLYWGNSEVLTDSIGLRSNQSDTMSGVLTINHTNDNQILLTSPSSWTGIGFNDSGASGTDYIWHNGTYNTFAIGGGGSSVSGKQLHIHGGTTIGSGFAGTSNPSNGLSVQGSIESGGTIGSNTSQTRDKLRVWNDGNYTIGFKTGFGFGHLGNSIGTATEYAMTFQTNNQSGRGWWWGTSSDNDNQGSMGLSNEGRANIKTSLSIGEGNTTAPSTTPLYVEGSTKGSTVFDVQGTQGQLFSITDDLTGDLFTVSDITGIPILTVNSLGTVTVDDTLHVTGDVIAYYASDRRLKENIKSISNPLDKIKLIGGYEFDWNQLSKNEGHDVGVIAQEIEEVLPELVGVRGDGYKGVKYEKLTALLIEAIKDQQSQIDDLKSKLNK